MSFFFRTAVSSIFVLSPIITHLLFHAILHSIVLVKISNFTLLDWYKSPDLWGHKLHGKEREKSHFQRQNYTIWRQAHKKTMWWGSLSINTTGLKFTHLSKGAETAHSLPVFTESDLRLLLSWQKHRGYTYFNATLLHGDTCKL